MLTSRGGFIDKSDKWISVASCQVRFLSSSQLARKSKMFMVRGTSAFVFCRVLCSFYCSMVCIPGLCDSFL